MSSLARRACYKCGNVGHYAEVCSSAERLCYNCKQPGHESNQCPLPRTTEAKQCYHCQGLGHVQADCPTLRLSGTANRCYSCGQPGHLASNGEVNAVAEVDMANAIPAPVAAPIAPAA
ncbi:Zinc finger protein GIS2 [Cytospora mali]|uniref:Zinc finger protein GIS2 n=1 Tax=Cytospora mali TaxID=578113 RepID=A0A194UY17_CYTMA|nr:Zinc finger protein GIS2 [Valsa mali var. pyri (nom. inval.)]